MEKIDIHNKTRDLARILERIQENAVILPENKETLLDFARFLDATISKSGIAYSSSRKIKLLDQMERVAVSLDKPFKKCLRADFEALIGKLRKQKNLKGQTISAITIADYGETVKRFYRWLEGHDEETPAKVKFWKTYVKQIVVLDEQDTYTETEILAIIEKGCISARDRALVAVGYETLARIGELGSLRVGSFRFENNGNEAMARMFGKTGQREAYCQFSVPFVKEWLAVHPLRNQPGFDDAPLFVLNQREKGFPAMTYASYRKCLNEAINRSGLNKKFKNPHLVFRKSRATHLAGIGASERDLMSLGGWASSDMVSHYVGQRNLKQIHARLAGKEEQARPKNVLEPKTCAICKHQNPASDTLKVCLKCGNPFSVVDALAWKNDNVNLATTVQVQKEMLKALVDKIEDLTKWKDGQDALLRGVFADHFAKQRGG